MKSLYKPKLALNHLLVLISMVLTLGVLMYGCKKPTDGINILVDSQLLSPGATTVLFVNADSTSTNQPGSFQVNISGPGASLVQMVSGGTNFQVSNGMLPLSLVKGTSPTPANPVTFTISGQAPGFATPFIKTITLTNIGASVYVVKAFDYLTASDGTSLLNTSATLNAGKLASALTLTTATSTSIAENATISFPTGTQMQDVNKNPIPASNLTCNVVQLGVNNDALTKDFPGGVFTQNAVDKGGNPINGGVGFVPAGLLAIGLNADNTPVRFFSNTVNINMEISSTLINLTTNAPVKVGDIVPVWSQNDQTGQWKYESDATVFLDADSKLAVTLPITHLSNWMCGWFWTSAPVAGKSTSPSTAGLTVKISSPSPVLGLDLKLSSQSGNVIDDESTTFAGIQADGSYLYQYTFANVPATNSVVSAYLPFSNTPLVTSAPFDGNGGGIISLAVPASALQTGPQTENIAINIQGVCNGKQLTLLPSATFALYLKNGANGYSFSNYFTIVNGIGNTALNVGATYYMATSYNGTYYKTADFTVTAGVIAIPAINGFNVSTTFDAPSNTLNLTGTIPINCN